MRYILCLTFVGLVAASGCRHAEPTAAAPPRIAVSNAYLAAAVRDLLGADTPVLTLAEPGTCPGHFDMRASQFEALRAGRLLLRFDFQRGLDDKLARLRDGGLTIAAIKAPEGMCVPSSYADAVAATSAALVSAGLLDEQQAAGALHDIRARMAALQTELRAAVDASELAGSAIVCSSHQARFCQTLGLDVHATFGGMDKESPAQVNAAVQAGGGIKCVIANRPEGTALAESLAHHADARLVVFDNFPSGQGAQSFDRMVRDNVARLVDTPRQ